jgi:hypothetical protein
MAENQSSLQELQGRSQLLMFRRRNFLQGLASVIWPFISQPQPVTPTFGRCKPEFSIGDKIRTSWEADGVSRSEIGEIVGVCWHPTHKHWEYLVVWGSSQFDEGLTDAKSLELHYA